MKEIMTNALKGAIVGLAKIIPGVSGAVLAISLGIYEKGLNAISKITKENIKFLINVGIGILFSIIIFSKIVSYSLNNYYLPTMLLFIGLIMGGIRDVKNNIKKFDKRKFVIFLITFLLLLSICTISGERNIKFDININVYIELIIAGVIDAFATVVPGISGTALLMIYGYYNIIINSIANIFDITNILNNLFVLSSYAIGLILGIILFSKIINYFFKTKKEYTYSSILGFLFATITILFLKTFSYKTNVSEVIFSLCLLLIGYFLAKKLSK